MGTAKLGDLTLRNFQSYGNNTTVINLDFKKAVLVTGRNLDSMVDGQVDSNGAGKSTIRNALAYVLYDKTFDTGVKVNDLINRVNGKNLKVTQELEKDGVYYRIERYRKLDKLGSGVRLLRKADKDEAWDDKHDVTAAGNVNVDDEIAKLIGIPFEIFTRIIAISATYTPFLELKLDVQRTIAEELFGFNELSEKAEKLKAVIKTNNGQMELLGKLDDQIKGELERHNVQLIALKQKLKAWNDQQMEKVGNLENQMAEDVKLYGDVDYDEEEAKFSEIASIEGFISKQTNVITLDQKSLATIVKQIKDADNWSKLHAQEIESIRKDIDIPLIFKTIEETQAFDGALKEFDTKTSNVDKLIVELEKNIANHSNAIKMLRSEISLIDQKKTSNQKELINKEHELIHLNDSKCPYCSQKYIQSKDKLADVETSMTNLSDVIRDLDVTKTQKQTKITEHEDNWAIAADEYDKQVEIKTTLTKEKQDFIIEILGTSNINLKKEYDKTLNREKLVNKLSNKEKETNPYLIDTTLEKLMTDKDEVYQRIDSNKKVIEDYRRESSELSSTLLFKSVTDIVLTKLQVENRKTALIVLQNEMNPHLDSYESLDRTQLSERKTVEIDALYKKLKHQEFLLKLLTKKDSFIRKALINKYIPFLNERIKYYLNKLGLPHKVQFKQDMTVGISQFKTEASFASLSSGQKARVNISLNFAFRDVLQSRYGTINFCILDEILDVGLGSTGVQLAVKMIKSWIKDNELSCLLISHRDEIGSSFDSKITIELKNGFSNIIQSDI